MLNQNERAWANQIIIEGRTQTDGEIRILQSYQSKVVYIDYEEHHISFGEDWDYSNTTLRAVFKFLQDSIGFDQKLSSDVINKALKDNAITDQYGEIWTVASGSEEFFDSILMK